MAASTTMAVSFDPPELGSTDMISQLGCLCSLQSNSSAILSFSTYLYGM